MVLAMPQGGCKVSLQGHRERCCHSERSRGISNLKLETLRQAQGDDPLSLPNNPLSYRACRGISNPTLSFRV